MLRDVTTSMAPAATPNVSSSVKSKSLASKSKGASPRAKAKEDNVELREILGYVDSHTGKDLFFISTWHGASYIYIMITVPADMFDLAKDLSKLYKHVASRTTAPRRGCAPCRSGRRHYISKTTSTSSNWPTTEKLFPGNLSSKCSPQAGLRPEHRWPQA